MIHSFGDEGTEDVFNGRKSRAARKACPETLWNVARRKLDYVNAASRLEDLRVPPGIRLEALTGDRHGQHSIRINDAVPGVLHLGRRRSLVGRNRRLPLSQHDRPGRGLSSSPMMSRGAGPRAVVDTHPSSGGHRPC